MPRREIASYLNLRLLATGSSGRAGRPRGVAVRPLLEERIVSMLGQRKCDVFRSQGAIFEAAPFFFFGLT
jgi:hypothetical protein